MPVKHEPLMTVVFGATGDLAKRLLLPALFLLWKKGGLASSGPILCIGRKDYSKQQFIKSLETGRLFPDADEKGLKGFWRNIHYIRLDLESCSPEDFRREVDGAVHASGTRFNRLFYLATPASLFGPVTGLLKESGLADGPGWKRVVYEKPFGMDSKSAEMLNHSIKKAFSEDQVYRIDHFLGKSLVQNILVTRFLNTLLYDIWDRRHIDCVQITVSETLGVEHRADFYEKAGVLRDMMQNHMLQILALAAMEPPKSLGHEDISRSKVRLLGDIRPPSRSDLVLGQYGEGLVKGMPVPGYRDEPGIPKDSVTPTYAMLRLFIGNRRWAGVPFYLRTGKRLADAHSEVKVVFKDSGCSHLCSTTPLPAKNIISFRIKPEEGVTVCLNQKRPGPGLVPEPVELSYCHVCRFGSNTPQAYEVLLQQAMEGDRTLFTSWAEVRASWRAIGPLLDADDRPLLHIYPAGSAGPAAADRLIKKDRRAWI